MSDLSNALEFLRAKRYARRDFEACADDLLDALQDVLRFAVDEKEFEYLRKGIGTSTPRGKALLKAKAAIEKAAA